MSLDALSRRLVSMLFVLSAPALLRAQGRGDTITLAPIVVTATRVPVPTAVIANAVTLLRGDELRERGIATVADALRTVASAAVVGTGSFGGQTSLFLRGGESDYVKVLLDGVPLNLPGGAFDWADLTTDDVDRIEVVRGPASVLYGSDAMAGVVQIFTRRGAGRPEARAGIEGADRYGTLRTRAELAGATRALGYSLGGSWSRTNGLYPFNNRFRNTAVGGRVSWIPDLRSTLDLTARYEDDVYHFPTASDGQPVDSNQFTSTKALTLSLDGSRQLTARLEARALVGFRQTLPRFDNPPDGPADSSGDFHSADTVRRVTGSVLVSYHLSPVRVFTVGVDHEVERQRGRSLFTAYFGSFPDSINVRRRNTGYFAQALAELGHRIDLTLGGRLDDNERFGTFKTYRVGAAYRLGSGSRVRVATGTGFKEPSFIENYGGFGTVGKPDLRPERTRSYEAGAEQTLVGGRLVVSGTYFDQRFRDLVEFTFAPAPPDTSNYFNVAGATARGLEFGVGARIGRLDASATYTNLHSRVTDPGFDTGPDAAFARGKALLRRPTHGATLAAGYGVGGGVRVGWIARYVGHRDDLDFTRPAGSRRTTLPGYTRIDFSGEWAGWREARGPGWVARLRVENVFDARYEEVKNYRSARRTLFLGGEVLVGR